MNHPLSRMLVSLGALLAAYWFYALAVVPWIEPGVAAAQTPKSVTPPAEDRAIVRQIERLKPYFEKDAPELKDPIIIENPSFSLLIKDYKVLPNHRVEIKPCTMVFFPDGQSAPAGERVRAVVMRAPGGAVLDFDEDCDLSRAKIGRLLGGRMVGEVTISGNLSKSKDPADKSGMLNVTTHDVQLSQERIWTPHDVQFQLGPNRGSGSDLQILLAKPTNPGKDARRAVPRGIESIQLMRDVRLAVMLGGGLLAGKAAPNDAAVPPAAAPRAVAPPAAAPAPSPVEIRCQGAFRFDMFDYVATFEDRVDVVRPNPAGPSDQLTCELLAIYFNHDLKLPSADAKAAKGKPKSAADGAALLAVNGGAKPPADAAKSGAPNSKGARSFTASKIEARGNPVVARAPSADAEARGEHVEYQIHTGGLMVEGDQPVWLRYGQQQVIARLIRYVPGPEGQAPEVLAEGGGRLTGSVPNQPNSRFDVSWTRQLSMRPHEGKQLVSVLGDARVAYADMGSLAAEEIWLWLNELPPAGGVPKAAGAPAAKPAGPQGGAGLGRAASRFQPHSLLARGKVRIDSPQLGGRTDQLEVWFQQAEANVAAAIAASPAAGQPAVPAPGLAPGLPGSKPGVNKSHYEFAGQLTRVQLVLHGQQTSVRDVAISGGVNLVEVPPGGATEKPLKLTGDEVQLLSADAPNTTLNVIGRPGRVDARGLGLAGANIQLDKAANRLWIDGTGEMTLPFSHSLSGTDLQGRQVQVPPASAPSPQSQQPLTVSFTRGMKFDGRTAVYNGQVIARSGQQWLETARITARLVEPIDFSRPMPERRPELQQIVCTGGVRMENRSLAPTGKLLSIDRLQVNDLTIDQRTGDLRAAGPGWASTVRDQPPPEMGAQRGIPFRAVAPGAPAAAKPNDKSGMMYVRVRFQQGITGNIHRREVTFADQVRAVYGPVAGWADEIVTERAAELTPEQMLLTCDRMTAVDLGLTGGTGHAVQLEANGNARVEGQTFTAQGDRLTYAAEKQLLVLEGSGQSDAHLWRQVRAGEPPSHMAARKISYWRATNRASFDGVKDIDFNQVGGGPP